LIITTEDSCFIYCVKWWFTSTEGMGDFFQLGCRIWKFKAVNWKPTHFCHGQLSEHLLAKVLVQILTAKAACYLTQCMCLLNEINIQCPGSYRQGGLKHIYILHNLLIIHDTAIIRVKQKMPKLLITVYFKCT